MRERFWERYALEALDEQEWEALCDGCGLCCLHKLEDVDTGAIAVTDVACGYLSVEQCRCSDYENRALNEADCVPLKPEVVGSLSWLPDTCAYRRLDQHRALPYWHYLISGDRSLVHTLGVSAKSARSVDDASDEYLESRIVRWVDKNGKAI